MNAPDGFPEEGRLAEILLAAATGPAWVLDAKGLVLRANRQAHALAHAPVPPVPETDPVRHLRDYLPVFASPDRWNQLLDMAAAGAPWRFEVDVPGGVLACQATWLEGLGKARLVLSAQDVTSHRQAEEAVRRERQRFNYLLEAQDGPVLLVGEDDVIRYCNRASRKRMGARVGLRRGDLLDMPPAGRSFSAEGRYEAWELSLGDRHYHMTSLPMTDADGAIVRILRGVDITERKEMELRLAESERKLQAIVAHALEGIVVLVEGRFVFANAYMVTLSGHPPEALLGRDFTPFIHPQDRAFVREVHARRLRGETVPSSYEFRLLHATGPARWVQVASTLLDWEGRQAVLSLLADITARKQAEEGIQEVLREQDRIIHERTRSLMQANISLEKEVGERTEAEEALRKVNESLWQSMETQRKTARKLELASRKALESTRAKSQFLANMSHEIRTPLNVILGMAQVAARDAVPGQNVRPLEMIQESGRLLLTILNDILDFSKIEAHRLALEQDVFDLHARLESLRESFSLAAADKGLRLTLDINPRVPRLVRGDSTRLSQVLNNLLSNALKFTSQGGVAVAVKRTRRGRRGSEAHSPGHRLSLLVTVTDTGMGISQDKIRNIFKSFRQGDNSVARQHGGTGLGLTISRRLARLMGGDVWVRSTPGQGSRFYFNLLLEEVDACLLESRHACASRTLPPLRLLLAEDTPMNAELMEALLAPLGHQVILARDGREALETLRAAHAAGQGFDLILMDVQMPVMDGLTVTRVIRSGEDPALPRDIPIVALTAHSMEHEVREILAAGVTRHVAKPVELPRLLAAMAQALGGKVQTGRSSDPDAASALPAMEDGDALACLPVEGDRQAVLARLGGSETLLRKLRAIFLRDAPGQMEDVRKAVAAGDAPAVANASHAMKGNAASIGLDPLARAARLLEQAGRENQATLFAPRLRQLEEEWKRAWAWLNDQGVQPAA